MQLMATSSDICTYGSSYISIVMLHFNLTLRSSFPPERLSDVRQQITLLCEVNCSTTCRSVFLHINELMCSINKYLKISISHLRLAIRSKYNHFTGKRWHLRLMDSTFRANFINRSQQMQSTASSDADRCNVT